MAFSAKGWIKGRPLVTHAEKCKKEVYMFRYFFIVVALTASLVGCATQDEITLTAYKTLETSAITYDTVMTAASDMHSQGKLQDADWEKLKDAALVYYEAYQVAVSGLLTYIQASEGISSPDAMERGNLKALVDKMTEDLQELLKAAIALGVDVKEVSHE